MNSQPRLTPPPLSCGLFFLSDTGVRKILIPVQINCIPFIHTKLRLCADHLRMSQISESFPTSHPNFHPSRETITHGTSTAADTTGNSPTLATATTNDATTVTIATERVYNSGHWKIDLWSEQRFGEKRFSDSIITYYLRR